MAKFKEALDSHKHKDAVEADSKAANAAQISGTPAFVVGKYFVNGAQPYPQFKRTIDRALKEAK
jgi:predicted DsbA family dithiol-disulfide isomerase